MSVECPPRPWLSSINDKEWSTQYEFAIHKVGLDIEPFSTVGLRSQFYDKCKLYKDRFGWWPHSKLYETLWEQSNKKGGGI